MLLFILSVLVNGLLTSFYVAQNVFSGYHKRMARHFKGCKLAMPLTEALGHLEDVAI